MGEGMWRLWETGEIYTGIWFGHLRKTDHLEYLGVHRKTLLKWISKTRVGEEWTGLILLRIRTVGGRL